MNALSRRDYRRDRLSVECLGHRDQRHRRAITPRLLASPQDFVLHRSERAW